MVIGLAVREAPAPVRGSPRTRGAPGPGRFPM